MVYKFLKKTQKLKVHEENICIQGNMTDSSHIKTKPQNNPTKTTKTTQVIK